MIASVVDLTRSWSSALNRFGIGAITIWLAAEIWKFPISETPTNSFDFHKIVQLAAVFMATLIVGNVCVHLGGFLFREPFREPRLTLRGVRVGRTQNLILIESYRDAMSKLQLISGMTGSMILILFVLILYGLQWKLGSRIDTQRVFMIHFADLFVLMVAALIARIAITNAATYELTAIDKALDEFYPSNADLVVESSTP